MPSPRRIEPIAKIIGYGPPGGKTLGLFNDRAAIEKAGIVFPSLAALTPELFEPLVENARNSRERRENPEWMKYAVEKTGFSRQMKEAIEEGALSFPKISGIGYAVHVRADDYAAGLGLTFSYPVFGKHKDEFVHAVNWAVKEAIASNFGANMQLFRERIGDKPSHGVMIMPFCGICERGVAYSQFVINYLGKSQGRAWISFSPGAADPQFSMQLRSGGVKGKDLDYALKWAGRGNMRAINLGNNIPTSITRRFRIKDKDGLLSSINRKIDEYVDGAGIRYAELIKPSPTTKELVIVQSAPINVNPVETPDVDKACKIMTSKMVMGTGIAHTTKMFLVKDIILAKDVRDEIRKFKIMPAS